MAPGLLRKYQFCITFQECKAGNSKTPSSFQVFAFRKISFTVLRHLNELKRSIYIKNLAYILPILRNSAVVTLERHHAVRQRMEPPLLLLRTLISLGWSKLIFIETCSIVHNPCSIGILYYRKFKITNEHNSSNNNDNNTHTIFMRWIRNSVVLKEKLFFLCLIETSHSAVCFIPYH